MSKKRHQHSLEFNAALAATKDIKAVAEVASEAGVHPNLISQKSSSLLTWSEK